jgi:hypothetical protein
MTYQYYSYRMHVSFYFNKQLSTRLNFPSFHNRTACGWFGTLEHGNTLNWYINHLLHACCIHDFDTYLQTSLSSVKVSCVISISDASFEVSITLLSRPVSSSSIVDATFRLKSFTLVNEEH